MEKTPLLNTSRARRRARQLGSPREPARSLATPPEPPRARTGDPRVTVRSQGSRPRGRALARAKAEGTRQGRRAGVLRSAGRLLPAAARRESLSSPLDQKHSRGMKINNDKPINVSGKSQSGGGKIKINPLQVLFHFSMEIKPPGGGLGRGKKGLGSNTVLHAAPAPLPPAARPQRTELD